MRNKGSLDTTRFSGVEFQFQPTTKPPLQILRSLDCQRVELNLGWFHCSSVSTRWQSKLRVSAD